jgi:hypothetical protein
MIFCIRYTQTVQCPSFQSRGQSVKKKSMVVLKLENPQAWLPLIYYTAGLLYKVPGRLLFPLPSWRSFAALLPC